MSNGEHPRPHPSPSDPAPAYADLRSLILDGPSVEDFLRELSAIAAGIHHGARCAFTLDHDERAVSVAASDGVAAWLDEIQYLHGDGPALVAMRTGARVDMPALADDDRWEDFGSYALAFGVGSGVCLPLVVQGSSIGVLSLYAPGSRALSDSDVERAQWIVDEAAAGLSMALRRSGVVPDDELPHALASRRVIDQALGVLMHARQVTSSDALDTLLDIARTSSRSPTDVAVEIIDRMTREPGGRTDGST